MKGLIAYAKWWWSRFRYVIHIDGDEYLIRYRLFLISWLGGVYIHHIVRHDNDREPHDHPFDFISVVLWGGYVEYRYWPSNAKRLDDDDFDMVTRRIGSIACRKATDFHRVELLNGKPVWTLFIRGPRKRNWGFCVPPLGWLDHRTFDEYRVVRNNMEARIARGEITSYTIKSVDVEGDKVTFKVDAVQPYPIENVSVTFTV